MRIQTQDVYEQRLQLSLLVQSTLQDQVSQNMEAEQELQLENRKLRQQLEEVKRSSARLSQERDEMARALEERDRDRDALRKDNTQLDEQKKQHERIVDKLNKEVCVKEHRRAHRQRDRHTCRQTDGLTDRPIE